MSKADEFLKHFTALDNALNATSVETQTKQIGEVNYTIHTFEDGSKFTQGSNGYIGSETPT